MFYWAHFDLVASIAAPMYDLFSHLTFGIVDKFFPKENDTMPIQNFREKEDKINENEVDDSMTSDREEKNFLRRLQLT